MAAFSTIIRGQPSSGMGVFYFQSTAERLLIANPVASHWAASQVSTTSSASVALGKALWVGHGNLWGKVNTIAPDATASAQRESIITMSCSVGWKDPQDETRSLAWVRQFYRDLFSETGGVPVPGDVGNGALINHPDIDLADPDWNTSGVPWYMLYYKGNYPRLQRIKADWDPLNIFHHALSIPLPENIPTE